mgnify:CR=1 FL=1
MIIDEQILVPVLALQFASLAIQFGNELAHSIPLHAIVKANCVVQIELGYAQIVIQIEQIHHRTKVLLEPVAQLVVPVAQILAADVVVARHKHVPGAIVRAHAHAVLERVGRAKAKDALESSEIAIVLFVARLEALVEQVAHEDYDVGLHVAVSQHVRVVQVAVRVPASDPAVVPRFVLFADELRVGDEQQADLSLILVERARAFHVMLGP